MTEKEKLEKLIKIGYTVEEAIIALSVEPKPEPKPEPKSEPKPEPKPEPKKDPDGNVATLEDVMKALNTLTEAVQKGNVNTNMGTPNTNKDDEDALKRLLENMR